MVITKIGAVELNGVSATLRELDVIAVRRVCSMKLTSQVYHVKASLLEE